MAELKVTKKVGQAQRLDTEMDEVLIEINPDGTVTGDVLCGPGGEGCLAILQELLGDLGPGEPDKKDEFNQKVGGASKLRVGGEA